MLFSIDIEYPPLDLEHPLAGLGKAVHLTRSTIRSARQLGRLAAIRVTLKQIAVLALILASIGDGASIAIVGVD